MVKDISSSLYQIVLYITTTPAATAAAATSTTTTTTITTTTTTTTTILLLSLSPMGVSWGCEGGAGDSFSFPMYCGNR